MKFKIILFSFWLMLLGLSESCKKLVEIPQPQNTVTDVKVFSSDTDAESAIAGVYYSMTNPSDLRYSNSFTSIAAGLVSDELINRFGGPSFNNAFANTILPNDGMITQIFWAKTYYNIYQVNAIIEGLTSSKSVSASIRNEIIGEAKFIRAYCYFYLANLFGDVPLITQSDWRQINLLPRSKVTDVYSQIKKDLIEAQQNLTNDYTLGGGEKIRPNRWAATSLLARVYLYTGDWANAETQASEVINSGNFSVMGDLSKVFLKNSDEAIWQLQTLDTPPYAVAEANFDLPFNKSSSPGFILTPSLLSAFQGNDARRRLWVDSVFFQNKFWYYPGKYKVRTGTKGNLIEYYMMIRYAELFLIRSEARAKNGTNLQGAIDDINVLRSRAGVPPLSNSLGQTEILAANLKERQIEYFAEWGHRWLDLKRTGAADGVLSLLKPKYQPTAKLWPIPISEIQANPNLTQNPGY